MDERGCISRKRFELAHTIAEKAMSCSSRKAAEPIIKQLEQLRHGIPNRCNIKIGELKSALLVYCNQRTDRYLYYGNVMNILGGLEGMVSEEIEDEEWMLV